MNGRPIASRKSPDSDARFFVVSVEKALHSCAIEYFQSRPLANLEIL
jgi:hypothetical protein